RFLIVDLYNGSYHEQKTGHEIFNEIKNPIDNKYYAYIPDYDNPNIEKLGATKNDLFIDDVLIIFVRRISNFNSNRRVIGFYPNARVYKNAIKKEYFNRNFIDKEGTLQTSSYSVESDTYIEVLEDDTFIIETDKYSKWMFRKQRVYPNTYPDLDIKILDFIDNYNKHKVDDDLAIQDSIQYIESATPSIIKKAPYKAIIVDNLPSGKSIRRDHTLAKASILKAQYKCELDHTHQTFLNKQQKPYMEGHHFIPLTYNNAKDYWHRFGRNIDCVENIVSLCPNCHR